MRDQLQARFNPLTDVQKWCIYIALWPLCLGLSLATLYLAYDRPASWGDVQTGYLMLPFSLPYSFLHSLTFRPWFDGEARLGLLTLFWLPFIVAHLQFFYRRNGWLLAVLSFIWIVAAFRWHYYALVIMRL